MKYIEGLVSLIVPCYNGCVYIEQCFSSILNQTYKKIELIFVDDGSEDGSFETAERWKERFDASGIKLICLTKPNGGAASAVNLALKKMSGEFFEVLDIDDYIYPRNIEAKVEYLYKRPSICFVRNDGEIYSIEQQKVVSQFTTDETDARERNIFNDLIFGKTYNWSGSYLLRTEAFMKRNKGLDIYISKYGQNMQLLLPLANMSDCGFIPECLTRYNEYPRSVSHSSLYERNLNLLDGYMDIRLSVLKHIDALPASYQQQIEQYYIRKKMELAYRSRKKKDAVQFYQELNPKMKKDRILFYRIKYPFAEVAFMAVAKIMGKR